MIYCLSCKRKTSDKEPREYKSNGRKMIKARCSVCGKKKSQFVSSQKGGSLEPTNKIGIRPYKRFDPALISRMLPSNDLLPPGIAIAPTVQHGGPLTISDNFRKFRPAVMPRF